MNYVGHTGTKAELSIASCFIKACSCAELVEQSGVNVHNTIKKQKKSTYASTLAVQIFA